MRIHKLGDMQRGWFVGDFEPTAYATASCEVAVKQYKAGDCEAAHRHDLADELTAVLSGRVRMNGQIFAQGDIVTVEKGETCDFQCLEDAVTVVFKSASVKNDKHPRG